MPIFNLFGPPNVEKLKARRAVSKLTEALAYRKDPGIRRAAALAVGEIGEPDAIAPLIDLLSPAQEPQQDVRGAASDALSMFGSRAVPALVSRFRVSKDPEVRMAVARLLQSLGVPAIEALSDLMKEESDFETRADAAQILADMGPDAFQSLVVALGARLEGSDVVFSRLGAAGLKALAALSQDSQPSTRLKAVQILARIGGGSADDDKAQACSILATALVDGYRPVREAAAAALEKLGWQPGQDESGAAYWTLKRQFDRCVAIGEPAVRPLILALGDPDRNVWVGAARALGELHAAEAVTPIFDLLIKVVDRSRPLSERNANKDVLLTPLTNIARTDPRPFVLAMSHGNGAVREMADTVLKSVGWQPDTDESAIHYAIARDQWDRCLAIGEPAVRPLLNALLRPDFPGREGAAAALGKIAAQSSDEMKAAVTEALVRVARDDQKPSMRQAAAVALGELLPLVEPSEVRSQGVDTILAVLQGISADGYAHYEAKVPLVQALGDVGDRRAMPALEAILKHVIPDWPLSAATALALEKLGWQPATPREQAILWSAQGEWKRCSQLGAGAVGALYTALKASQAGAVAALVDIGAPAVDVLLDALHAPEPAHRSKAGRALAQIWADATDTTTRDTILAKLSAAVSNPYVRQEAASVLVRIGEPAVDTATKLLWDKNATVRQVALWVLASIGGDRAIDVIIKQLGDPYWEVRAYAVQLLRGLRVPRAADALITTMLAAGKYVDVRKAARDALSELGAQAVRPILRELGSTQQADRDELVTLCLPHMDALCLGVKDELVAVRRAAVALLPKCQGFPVALLITASRDPDITVRRFAVEGLGRPGNIVSGELASALVEASRDADSGVRRLAVDALGRSGNPLAAEALISSLRDQDAEVRRLAAVAAGGMRSLQLVEPLKAALADPDDKVVQTAVWALDQCRWQPSRDEAGARYWIAKRQWLECCKIGAPAFPLLRELLRYTQGDVGVGIARALAQSRQDEACELLTVALCDHQSVTREVRAAAAEALGDMGDARAVKPLITALRLFDHYEERRTAAAALRKLYTSKQLTAEARQAILAARYEEFSRHEDRVTHHYDVGGNPGDHEDMDLAHSDYDVTTAVPIIE